MAEKAPDEHAGGIEGHGDLHIQCHVVGLQSVRPGDEERGGWDEPDASVIPPFVIEGDDEGRQVQRQRHHPERHGCDVLRDVIRDGQQQPRAHCRQRQPQTIVVSLDAVPEPAADRPTRVPAKTTALPAI